MSETSTRGLLPTENRVKQPGVGRPGKPRAGASNGCSNQQQESVVWVLYSASPGPLKNKRFRLLSFNLVDFFNSHPKSVNFSVLVSQSVFFSEQTTFTFLAEQTVTAKSVS
jgi:hypothetical protein